MWHRPSAVPPYSWETSKYRPDPEHDKAFTYTRPPYAPATGIFTPEATFLHGRVWSTPTAAPALAGRPQTTILNLRRTGDTS